MKKTSFTRGAVFSADNGNMYILVRESRPATDPISGRGVGFYYNLLNLDTGKMRWTESGRAFANNEPISMDELTSRFGGELKYHTQVGEAYPHIVPIVKMKADDTESTSDHTRGDVFVNMDNGGLYVLCRESRPDVKIERGQAVSSFFYNLFNLRSGKMRWTESDRAYRNNEPITITDLTERVGADMVYIGALEHDFATDITDTIRSVFPSNMVHAALDLL